MKRHVGGAAMIRALTQEMSKVIVGKQDLLERLALALIAEGHVLLEDNPGVAKTLAVKTLSQAVGLSFKRVQFTPDLLPADITGSFFYNLQANRFELRKGPIFTNVLLADEINRAPPKTQAALLEAMQEKQTTLEGETHALPDPFFVFATQNPIEVEGTYPLPEAQLDRFLMRLSVGYPGRASEVEILRRKEAAGRVEPRANVALDASELRELQDLAGAVRLDDGVKDYIVRLVEATREDSRVALGASPRASIALFKLAKAHALARGRAYAIPDDVKELAAPCLAHRIVLKGEARVRRARAEDVVAEALANVAAPDLVRATLEPDARGR